MTVKTTAKKAGPMKLDAILKHLSHKNGAAVAALEKLTGWQPHSVRAALTQLRQKGYSIENQKNAKGVTVYRIGKVSSA